MNVLNAGYKHFTSKINLINARVTLPVYFFSLHSRSQARKKEEGQH